MPKKMDELYRRFYNARRQELCDQIYSETYSRVLQETGDQAEAHLQALDAAKNLVDDEAKDYAQEMVRQARNADE